MYDKTCGSESRKRSAEARVRGYHPTGMGMRDKGELCVSMSSGAGSRAVRRHSHKRPLLISNKTKSHTRHTR